MPFLPLFVRDLPEEYVGEIPEGPKDPLIGTPGHCDPGNGYNGLLDLRIAAIFAILIGSLLGSCLPVAGRHLRGHRVPNWAFEVAKYFGSGIIIGTAFIHLLTPAHEALSDPCLTGAITEYSWVEGIVMMTIFAMFFLEYMTMRYGNFGGKEDHGHAHEHDHFSETVPDTEATKDPSQANHPEAPVVPGDEAMPGHDQHLAHFSQHTDNADIPLDWEAQGPSPESYAAQVTAIFILEFGVIFHSVFIGLTLAVAGEELRTLITVITLHQTFEGLGLGSRLAGIPWPARKRWTPYYLAVGYSISTPIAIAVGLGIRQTYAPGSQTTLVVNGVFDSISAGILIYTGLVELMAHEFMFSNSMKNAPIYEIIKAFVMMCLGAGVMAVLGKWA